MRVSSKEKERSRRRILAVAGRLMREKGIAGSSVSDIMTAAGMTHGGFYRHFASKEDLLAEALADSFEAFARPLLDVPEDTAQAAADAFRSRYLSAAHRASPGEGCPAAALGSDIARSDRGVQEAFRKGVNRIAEGLARARPEGEAARRAALRDLATMVGAMVLARAAGDPLASEVLDACADPPA